ncbi:putative lysine methyltransferase, S-adenosyl-L-methionine-dependent methyltransferase [Helianthus anomalus]
MRAPSLLSQCLPGLAPDRVSQSMSTASDREMHLPSPAVEIIPSKLEHPYKYAGDSIDLQGVNIFKGRVSVSDMIGSELITSKTDGSFKSWDSSFDLVNVLKHEIRDAQLSFRGKKVLELGCGYGLSGIFACLKLKIRGFVGSYFNKKAFYYCTLQGASVVHFQDSNAENIRTTTIPNVMANLQQARDRQIQQPESSLTPSRQFISPVVNFYAGEWEELATVLSVIEGDLQELPKTTNISFTEEDFIDGCSSQDGSIMGRENSSRRSTKLSGSRVWERASETDQGEGGYDIILMTDIPYSPSSLKKLYALIKKCLKPPYGVLFVSAKKHYVGFNSAARQLRSLVDEEGVFGSHLIKGMTDKEIWKFFLK